MWTRCVFLIVATVTGFGYCNDVESSPPSDPRLAEGEERLSGMLLHILEHFKQTDPVGLPAELVDRFDLKDPQPVPDMKQSLSFATVFFKNTSLFGVSQFRILYVTVEVGSMEVRAQMVIDKLHARGNYTMSTWLNRAQGPYVVDITGLKVIARGNLGVGRDGRLRPQDIYIDLGFSTINVNFQNLGFFGSVFQGVINSIGNFLFDSIKPYILKEAYAKITEGIDVELEKVAGDIRFPNSISPLDMVVADLRKTVRAKKWDPMEVKDYNTTVSIFTVTLANTWLLGASSFQRVGNITLKMENNTLIADFEIGTQKLEGMTQWDISAISGLMSRAGTASFSAEYISGRFVLAQPLDTRQKPQFRDMDLEIGNIQVRCDGAGTLDYVVEFAVNILPNLLRYQIMDAIKNPVKEKIQQELDKLDVEELIQDMVVPEVDKMQKKGFKLSALKENAVDDETYDDDQFFNF